MAVAAGFVPARASRVDRAPQEGVLGAVGPVAARSAEGVGRYLAGPRASPRSGLIPRRRCPAQMAGTPVRPTRLEQTFMEHPDGAAMAGRPLSRVNPRVAHSVQVMNTTL